MDACDPGDPGSAYHPRLFFQLLPFSYLITLPRQRASVEQDHKSHVASRGIEGEMATALFSRLTASCSRYCRAQPCS